MAARIRHDFSLWVQVQAGKVVKMWYGKKIWQNVVKMWKISRV